MGWYTTGPGELQYKYGDVFAVARSSKVGTLLVIPRVAAFDPDGELIEAEDLMFLGPLQAAIERRGLPWRHLDLALDVDASGESIRVPVERPPAAILDDIADLVAEHAASVCQTITEVAGQDVEVARLAVSIECRWTVAPAEIPALLAWLNAPLGEASPITVERLREGSIDELDDYVPSEALEDVFASFEDGDAPRHLAAYALAMAVLADEPLYLDQPDDDHQQDAWSSEEEEDHGPGAVLFRPVDHPFLDLLARAFDLPLVLRECVFFVHGASEEIEMPPEAELPAADTESGFAFVRYVAGRCAAMPSIGRIAAAEDDHGRNLSFGWHTGGSFDEVAGAFHDAGITVLTMDQFVATERAPYRGISAHDRLVAIHSAGDEQPELAYVLAGGEPPAVVTPMLMSVLLLVLEDLELPVHEQVRLEEIVRTAARAGAASDQ